MTFIVDRELYADVAAEPETIELAQVIAKAAVAACEGQPQHRFALAMVRATAALVQQCAKPGQAGELLAASADFLREKAASLGSGAH